MKPIHPEFRQALDALAKKHPSIVFGCSEWDRPYGTEYRIHAGPDEWPICHSGWQPTPRMAVGAMEHALESLTK